MGFHERGIVVGLALVVAINSRGIRLGTRVKKGTVKKGNFLKLSLNNDTIKL